MVVDIDIWVGEIHSGHHWCTVNVCNIGDIREVYCLAWFWTLLYLHLSEGSKLVGFLYFRLEKVLLFSAFQSVWAHLGFLHWGYLVVIFKLTANRSNCTHVCRFINSGNFLGGWGGGVLQLLHETCLVLAFFPSNIGCANASLMCTSFLWRAGSLRTTGYLLQIYVRLWP